MCFSKEKIGLKKLLNILPSLLVNNHFIMNNSGQVPSLLLKTGKGNFFQGKATYSGYPLSS